MQLQKLMNPWVTAATVSQTTPPTVDRLGRAIEAAEEEIDAALKRTTDFHRSQLRQRENEAAELQRMLAAKDREATGLKDTMHAAKRSYEQRLSQTEAALMAREQEVKPACLSACPRTAQRHEQWDQLPAAHHMRSW